VPVSNKLPMETVKAGSLESDAVSKRLKNGAGDPD